MSVHIAKRRGALPRGTGALRRRAVRLLELLDLSATELSLLLTEDREMTALNHNYRGKRRSTDVLSFCQVNGASDPALPRLLGDVVISVPTAQRQARTRGASLLDELTVLLVHGVLHLCGFEHEGVPARVAGRMFREQERLVEHLQALGPQVRTTRAPRNARHKDDRRLKCLARTPRRRRTRPA